MTVCRAAPCSRARSLHSCPHHQLAPRVQPPLPRALVQVSWAASFKPNAHACCPHFLHLFTCPCHAGSRQRQRPTPPPSSHPRRPRPQLQGSTCVTCQRLVSHVNYVFFGCVTCPMDVPVRANFVVWCYVIDDGPPKIEPTLNRMSVHHIFLPLHFELERDTLGVLMTQTQNSRSQQAHSAQNQFCCAAVLRRAAASARASSLWGAAG